MIGFSNKKMLVILALNHRIIITSQTLKKRPVTSNMPKSVWFMQFSFFVSNLFFYKLVSLYECTFSRELVLSLLLSRRLFPESVETREPLESAW